MKHRIPAAATLAAAALALPAAAQAHVTVQPKEAVAGGFTVESVRVPNETDDAVTTKVAVRFPPGFASVSYQPVDGWKVTVVKEKLATPVKTDDGEVTEGVKTITFTADSKADGIQPGQFRDFPLSLQLPGKAGDTLTFKAVQTYSDGEIARWIGPPDADKPAPQVTLTADPAAAAPGGAGATAQDAAAPVAPASSGNGGSSDTLGVIALIVGALGLLAGGTALASARKRA